ncbi:unnamed protein product [Miscanthus lutarioriparius]|uniref:Uncharacterized protein n=1 Tax=Miscanthus lutarioriparius TaxID=422564 RepID=A0A811QDD8_9POAL|nr:unnamed protein product [Miscanthus lutarioriparius]
MASRLSTTGSAYSVVALGPKAADAHASGSSAVRESEEEGWSWTRRSSSARLSLGPRLSTSTSTRPSISAGVDAVAVAEALAVLAALSARFCDLWSSSPMNHWTELEPGERGVCGRREEGEVVAVAADAAEEGEREREDEQQVGGAAAYAAVVEMVGERSSDYDVRGVDAELGEVPRRWWRSEEEGLRKVKLGPGGPSPTGGAKRRAVEQRRSSQGIIMEEGLPIAEAANFPGRVENPYWAHSMCNPTSTGLLSNRAYRSNLATPVPNFFDKNTDKNFV